MNLETKAVTTFTSGYNSVPLWSPRVDLIMFARQIDGAYDIFTIKPDGTSLKRLTNARGNDPHMWWLFRNLTEMFVMRYGGTHVEQLTGGHCELHCPRNADG